MPKIGDTVRFLNSVGGGRIVRIDGNIAHVEDEDGFDVPALLKECVVVMEASAAPKREEPKPQAKVPEEKWWEKTVKEKSGSSSAPQSKETVSPTAVAIEPETIPIVETPEGNKLNVVLGFEANDIKQLSSTTFEASLVNDSNYFLNFVFATRANEDEQWTLRRAATVEPNIVLTLGQYAAADLQAMDRVLVQIIAYKSDRKFASKQPISVEHRLDTTKFFKLHCFKDNPYFDNQVIALELVKDDRPYSPMKIDERQLRDAMREKKAAERPTTRPVKKRTVKPDGPIEVDLHITELVDSTRGLSNADMLNLQIDEFRRVMDANLKNHGQKIIFIHGKGEGVLRQALMKELNHRYKGHDVQDASFREYGFGATQVTIR